MAEEPQNGSSHSSVKAPIILSWCQKIFKTGYNSVVTFVLTSHKSIILFTINCNQLICRLSSFFFLNLRLFYVHEYFACTYVCAQHTCLVLQRSEEGFGFPKTRVMDDCELPYGCWQSNSGSLQKQVPLSSKSISPAQGFLFTQQHNSIENNVLSFLFVKVWEHLPILTI